MAGESIGLAIFFWLFAAPKVKKEYLSHAKVMENMGSAKSLAFRGKSKAGDLGKLVVEPIELDFGSPKSSSTSRSHKRKRS